MSQPHMPVDGSSASAMTNIMGMYNSAKNKWDSSGGNEALGRMSASIPEGTKTYVASMFKREHIRSISVYFGIGEERPFYFEKNPSLLVERLRHNFTFFYLNYMILTALLFCLAIVMSPLTILGVAALGVAWMWFIRASSSGTLSLGVVSIPQKTGTFIMGGISVLFLLWLFKSVFWWTLFSSGFLILLHAVLRDASMHKDMDDAVAMEGDIAEDASFLNPARVDAV